MTHLSVVSARNVSAARWEREEKYISKFPTNTQFFFLTLRFQSLDAVHWLAG